MNLCHRTGAVAVDDECPVHKTDECITHFVPADDEWRTLRRERDDAVDAARTMLHRLREAQRALQHAVDGVTKPRERAFDTYPPLLAPKDTR